MLLPLRYQGSTGPESPVNDSDMVVYAIAENL